MNRPTLDLTLFALIATAGCSDPAVSVDGDGGSTSSADSGPGPSAGGDAQDTTGGPTTVPSNDSSGTTESGETLSAECGNGVVELDEACDDGNRTNADGCNTDCSVSGSVSWTWEPDEGSVAHVTVADDDTVYVAVLETTKTTMNLFQLSGEGELLEQWSVIGPRSPIAGGTVALEGGDLTVLDGQPIYAADAVVRDEDGIYNQVIGLIVAPGPSGWETAENDRFSIRLVATTTGELVGCDGATMFKYSATGEEIWRVEAVGCRAVVATPTGGLVTMGGDAVSAFDASGALSWTVSQPAGNALNGFRALTDAPDGAVLVMQQEIVDPIRLTSIGRFWHIDSSGVVLTTEDWEFPVFTMATDPDGNIFLPGSTRGMKAGTAKLNPEFERLWTIAIDSGLMAMDADSTGALFVANPTGIVKLAP
ncbi:MAG: hypothetical protein JKY37_10930 [Nannocystaceae bacterium]|nr:hypothetical protein [Nannocystaceae bacterium]